MGGPGAVLIDNIGTLVTNDPELGTIEDAALVFGDGVAWAGPRRATPEAAGDERFDAGGRAVIPGFVDSTGTSSSPATALRSSRRGWVASGAARAASGRRSPPLAPLRLSS